MPKVVETEYGGGQFAIAMGLSAREPGKGILRVGFEPIAAGEVLGHSQLTNSKLGEGLIDPVVCDTGTYVMVTRQTSYGGSDPAPGAARPNRPSNMRVIEEKEIGGVQRTASPAAAAKAPAKAGLTLISEKEVGAVQTKLTPGAASGPKQ